MQLKKRGRFKLQFSWELPNFLQLTRKPKIFRLSLFPLWYLPDVVLVEVARNLDFKSLCQLMLVSWRFFELVLGNRRLWSRFKLHIKPCCHFTWPSAYRRFESVIFNDFNDEFCVAFSLDVKQICLMGCTSSKKKLVEFLKKSPSLELAHIFDHKFINCTNPEDIQLVQ